MYIYEYVYIYSIIKYSSLPNTRHLGLKIFSAYICIYTFRAYIYKGKKYLERNIIKKNTSCAKKLLFEHISQFIQGRKYLFYSKASVAYSEEK